MNLRGYIYTGKDAWVKLASLIEQYSVQGVFILVDENTANDCLPVLLEHCPQLKESYVIKVQAGEEFKTLSTTSFIWLKASQELTIMIVILMELLR